MVLTMQMSAGTEDPERGNVYEHHSFSAKPVC